MKVIFVVLASCAMLLLTAAANKPGEPTFKPGAQVTIDLTVKAPQGWRINYLLPVQVMFDKQVLKQAPFTVDKSTLSFTLKEYAEETVLTIPVKLKQNAKPGQLTVPFDLDYSICEKKSDNCTFDVEDVDVKVLVEEGAPDGSRERALAAGHLPAIVQLPPAGA